MIQDSHIYLRSYIIILWLFTLFILKWCVYPVEVHRNHKFYNLKMIKSITIALCIAFFSTWISATIIISDTVPRVFDIGGGDTMLVIG